MSAPRLNRRCLVRGTARRVIIVPSSADSVYEPAIFVLRPEAAREVGPDELLREEDLGEMLRFANAAAGLITTKKGAIRSMPELSDIQRVIGG